MSVPRRYTSILAALLFLVFGAKMLKDGLEMTRGTDSVQDEMKEVEQELQEKDFTSLQSPTTPQATHPINAEALEAGSGAWKPKRRASALSDRATGGIMNLLHLLFSPVFVQTFIMTFLGEWGDRSQIATITLAAASGMASGGLHVDVDFWYVIVGTVVAHGICTAVAVIGGRLLASKISVRNGNVSKPLS